MKTKVKFLLDKIEDGEEITVFAFFPTEYYFEKGHPLYEDMFTSYSHIGQHSGCSLGYANECKEACLTDYLDLKKELESEGYKLDVLNQS